MVRNTTKLFEYVARGLNTKHNLADVLKRTHRTTPAFFSNWGFMQRCACGLASQDDLLLTLPTFFSKLALDEKLKFLRLTHAKPQQLKKNRLTLLATWLQDNAPVFSEFRWHTEAVLEIAANKFHDTDKHWTPQSPELLTQFCSRAKPTIKLGLYRVRYRHKSDRFAQPNTHLLSPPPFLV
jgi:hypothetical protein